MRVKILTEISECARIFNKMGANRHVLGGVLAQTNALGLCFSAFLLVEAVLGA